MGSTVVFSDGSKEQRNGTGYGYAIYRSSDTSPIATDQAALNEKPKSLMQGLSALGGD